MIVLAAAAVGVGVLAAVAVADMRSTRLEPKLCKTVGGGRFVKIPGFPGEKIDQRLLPDIEYLVDRFDIFITDGYSKSDVHARNGEHPLGLALDIVPSGKRWKKVNRLAKWAEPKQDQPRPPFRWVGYNGDAGHGRGDHLHLSWSHSDTKPFEPARKVFTITCPDETEVTEPPPEEVGEDTGGTGGDTGSGSGGVIAKLRAQQATAVPETE
jgi:hypothetical protein